MGTTKDTIKNDSVSANSHVSSDIDKHKLWGIAGFVVVILVIALLVGYPLIKGKKGAVGQAVAGFSDEGCVSGPWVYKDSAGQFHEFEAGCTEQFADTDSTTGKKIPWCATKTVEIEEKKNVYISGNGGGTAWKTCSLAEAKIGSEDCTNGKDDDGDGKVDCADSDCASDGKCVSALACESDSDGNNIFTAGVVKMKDGSSVKDECFAPSNGGVVVENTCVNGVLESVQKVCASDEWHSCVAGACTLNSDVLIKFNFYFPYTRVFYVKGKQFTFSYQPSYEIASLGMYDPSVKIYFENALTGATSPIKLTDSFGNNLITLPLLGKVPIILVYNNGKSDEIRFMLLYEHIDLSSSTAFFKLTLLKNAESSVNTCGDDVCGSGESNCVGDCGSETERKVACEATDSGGEGIWSNGKCICAKGWFTAKNGKCVTNNIPVSVESDCGNNKDDDNDGSIDCADSDCEKDVLCGKNMLVGDVNCDGKVDTKDIMKLKLFVKGVITKVGC